MMETVTYWTAHGVMPLQDNGTENNHLRDA